VNNCGYSDICLGYTMDRAKCARLSIPVYDYASRGGVRGYYFHKVTIICQRYYGV